MILIFCLLIGLVVPSSAQRNFKVPLYNAGATFAQASHGAEETIDGVVSSGNGWAVAPQTNQRQRIWWETDGMILGKGVGADFEAVLSFRGIANSPHTHLIRRFRLSVTKDAIVNADSTWRLACPAVVTASGAPNLARVEPLSEKWIELTGTPAMITDYLINGELPGLSGPITGISIEVEPVSGALGTAPSENFTLTEFNFELTNWSRLIVSESVGVVKAPGNLVLLGGDTRTAQSPDDLGEPSGSELIIVDDGVVEETEYVVYFLAFPDSSLGLVYLYIIDNDGPLTGYDHYVAGFGLRGYEAEFDYDADGDGVSNGMDYLFSRNPNGQDSSESLMKLPRVVQLNSGGLYGLRFEIPKPAPQDIRLRLLEGDLSTSLGDLSSRDGFEVGSLWTGPGASRVMTTVSENEIVVTAQAPESLEKHFFQFQIEKIAGGNGGAE